MAFGDHLINECGWNEENPNNIVKGMDFFNFRDVNCNFILKFCLGRD